MALFPAPATVLGVRCARPSGFSSAIQSGLAMLCLGVALGMPDSDPFAQTPQGIKHPTRAIYGEAIVPGFLVQQVGKEMALQGLATEQVLQVLPGAALQECEADERVFQRCPGVRVTFRSSRSPCAWAEVNRSQDRPHPFRFRPHHGLWQGKCRWRWPASLHPIQEAQVFSPLGETQPAGESLIQHRQV